MKPDDARKLDHTTLEEMRIRAVRSVQAGESPEVVARSHADQPPDDLWLAGAVSARWRECGKPSRDFATTESYFSTALHELGHWSGHATRLNRDLKNQFGSQAYAAEELIAELTSAFLCAHLAVNGELRHASYIDNWLALLKEDNRAIFTAALHCGALRHRLMQ